MSTPAPRVHLVIEKSFSRAQGWSQLVLALQRRRDFNHIGFGPTKWKGLRAAVTRRLNPRLESAWIRWAMISQPRSLVHFLWGDNYLFGHPPHRRFVMTLHQPYEKWERGTVERCKRLGGVHVLTERDADYLRDRTPGLVVRCILHGIDVDFWKPPATPPSREKRRIVFAGRYMRNIPMFLRLARRLLADYPDVEFEMLLHPDFKFSPDCLPLPPRVRVVGPFSAEEMRDFFQTAWLMLMPYDNVTASNSVCEALATGLPFFTSRVGGMESYAKGGMVLFENNADDEAYASVVRCLEEDAWRAELSAQARANAIKHLDWNIVSAQFESFYADIAAAAAAR